MKGNLTFFGSSQVGNLRYGRLGSLRYQAFTLIELLTVISIIALLAGLAVAVGGGVVVKNREARVKGDHAKLVTAIESYKAELGNYPPDNAATNKWSNADAVQYRKRAGRNPLFYELSGAVFEGGKFTTLNKNETISATALDQELGVKGIENSSRNLREVPFQKYSPKPSEYAEIKTASGTDDVEVLYNKLKGPSEIELDKKVSGTINPWLYDSSSTNRHNPESFDLWTEYLGKNRTNVYGNWKE